jgi:uncharacterized protein with von Willebrand factor type A (vWA) domain
MSAVQGVVTQLAKFAGAMREHGIRVGLSDEIDAATALTHIDLLDRDEVQRGLRIAFKVPRDAWATFDRLFDEHWGGATALEVPVPPRTYPREHRGVQWKWDGARVQVVLPEPERPEGDRPGYSSERLLRRKPFDQISASELAAMERLLARLALRLATRRSRRLVPTRGRGVVDLRHSFRHALRTEGELFRLARRARALEVPRVVLLYDTSGSMDPYTRFHLAFAFALRRVIRRLEIFTFNTALTRVTQAVAPAKIARSLERLAADVPDWSGGTRIGACLAEFVATCDAMVGRDTRVVIVSDGLDLGDTELLARSMRVLRERARTIVWLNPLMGDPRYEPTQAGMRAALPHVDHFGPAHNLESLERLLRFLS